VLALPGAIADKFAPFFAQGVFSRVPISLVAAAINSSWTRESVQPPRSNLDETRCHRGLDTTRQTGVSLLQQGATLLPMPRSFCNLGEIALEMRPTDLAL